MTLEPESVRQMIGCGAGAVVLPSIFQEQIANRDDSQWTSHWELTPVDSLEATVTGIIHARLGSLDLSIAASGGNRTAEDAIKAMIAGADVVMVTSEIYRSGPEAISKMVHGLERLVDILGFHSLAQFQQARPVPEKRSQRSIRSESIHPITRTTTYRDLTPVVEPQSGDRYGHQD